MTDRPDLTIDYSDPNALLAEYVSAYPYRNATSTELVNEDNPFRRPVRPHDLEFLNFARPVRQNRRFGLSMLIGHRMLRTAYDTSTILFAREDSPESERDRAELYAPRNRVLAAAAEPVLTDHLFGLIDTDIDTGSATIDEITRSLHDLIDRRRTGSLALQAALDARDASKAAGFLLAQLTAILPARQRSLARAAISEYPVVAPATDEHLYTEHLQSRQQAQRLVSRLEAASLNPQTTAYWQFFLATSMQRAHYLEFTARDGRRFGEFIGAVLHESATDGAQSEQLSGLHDSVYGIGAAAETGTGFGHDDVDRVVDALVAPLASVRGPVFVAGVLRGLTNAAANFDAWDEDLSVQLAWADALEEHMDKAEKLYHRIESEGIEVDLETFVESCEETSTTHVHNDTRLVVIEKGQMHFWNSPGVLIPMNEGDKVLIPSFRLHGSVVLTGSCTYHQPVITDELLASV
ncbi:hypothetical protein [Millisia brevis]|uniref:hypothetical protein n=1 Tax=Millisia brevis TaxID=264148 RepID=UPI00082DDF43|nr:hypothetical protein [Millisia brevis]